MKKMPFTICLSARIWLHQHKGMPKISVFTQNNIVFKVAGEKEYPYQPAKNYRDF